MTNINNEFGIKMQIRFSREFVHQSNKNNLESGLDFETEIGNVIDVARNIARVSNAEKDRIELYSYFYVLGKVEHGAKGLEYINQQLPENTTKITELEIAEHNLKKIFPDFDPSIGKELLDEYRMLYQDDSLESSEKITILRLSLLLEKISQGVRKTLLETTTKEEAQDASIRFKFEEIEKIKQEYKATGKFRPTKKMEDLTTKIDRLYSNFQLTEMQKSEIEDAVEEILKTAKGREELLDGIYSFNSQLNKKKVRGK